MIIRKSFIYFYIPVLISTLIYMLAIHFGHVNYLPYQKSAVGIFSVGYIDEIEWILLICVVALVVIFLPRNMDVISDIFSLVLYYAVYIPTIVLYAGRSGSLLDIKSIELIGSLTIGFIFITLIPKRNLEYVKYVDIPISVRSLNNIIIISIFLMAYIFANSFSRMNLVGLKETYSQRELGGVDISTSFGLLLGYSKTYLSYFFGPIILTFGLFKDRVFAIIFGIFIFIFCYSIAAERSIFLYPFFIVSLYYFLKRGYKSSRTLLIFLLLGSAGAIYLISSFSGDSEFVEAVGFLFFTRSIATPGQFIGDYYDYFSNHGYTMWSQLRGFNLIIDRPDYFIGDPLWPALGWIVGRDFHGINSNLNAGLWATDGIASGGPIGVLVVSCIFASYLFILNYFGRLWPRTFLIPVAFPLAFILTNGSLFTTLLSYGGALFAIFLWFFGRNFRNKYKLK